LRIFSLLAIPKNVFYHFYIPYNPQIQYLKVAVSIIKTSMACNHKFQPSNMQPADYPSLMMLPGLVVMPMWLTSLLFPQHHQS